MHILIKYLGRQWIDDDRYLLINFQFFKTNILIHHIIDTLNKKEFALISSTKVVA